MRKINRVDIKCPKCGYITTRVKIGDDRFWCVGDNWTKGDDLEPCENLFLLKWAGIKPIIMRIEQSDKFDKMYKFYLKKRKEDLTNN